MQYLSLQNGVKMPLEGFGVFQVDDPLPLRARRIGRDRVRLPPVRYGVFLPQRERSRCGDQKIGDRKRRIFHHHQGLHTADGL